MNPPLDALLAIISLVAAFWFLAFGFYIAGGLAALACLIYTIRYKP